MNSRKWHYEFILSGIVFAGLISLVLQLGAAKLHDIPPITAVIVCGVFLISHWLGAFFSRFPAGNDNAMTRLGLAAFCRTFAPLLALLLVDHYLMSVLTQGIVGLIAASYLSSFALTIIAAFRTPVK